MVDALYSVIKKYNIILATSIKDSVEQSIAPLSAKLSRRLLLISAAEEQELSLQTKRLRAEQNYVYVTEQEGQELMKHLGGLKVRLREPRNIPINCRISYAWPSKHREMEEEGWVQPFLKILHYHLKKAGIKIVIDVLDNNPGNSIHNFTSLYYKVDYIILVGTESLLEKHFSNDYHIMIS